MRADVARSVRRLRPHARRGTLARRADADLPFVARPVPTSGPDILPDTTVYADALEDRLPPAVRDLIDIRTLTHLSITVAGFAQILGRLDPMRPGNARILAEVEATIAEVPAHRLETPTAGVMLEAGILAGLAFRLGDFRPGRELAALNDAAIHLHARDRGYVLLTRNIRDFDILDQLAPGGRMLLYRAA